MESEWFLVASSLPHLPTIPPSAQNILVDIFEAKRTTTCAGSITRSDEQVCKGGRMGFAPELPFDAELGA